MASIETAGDTHPKTVTVVVNTDERAAVAATLTEQWGADDDLTRIWVEAEANPSATDEDGAATEYRVTLPNDVVGEFEDVAHEAGISEVATAIEELREAAYAEVLGG